METTMSPAMISRRTAITDIGALVFVGLVPAASHLFNIPVYYLEPMRIMLMLALLFSSRFNAFALAVVLPLFSFLVSGHPFPMKMMIIIAELMLNAWLFLLFYRSSKNAFLSTFGSILLSKLFCYAMYLVFFSMAFVREEAGESFLIAQGILTVLLSCAVWLIVKRREDDSTTSRLHDFTKGRTLG
jgi:hypothetical protein